MIDIRKELYIGGEWVATDAPSIAVWNPADGSLICHVGSASTRNLDQAVAAAKEVLSNPAWRDLLPHERGRLLARMGALIDQETDHLARIQMLDNGKTIDECRAMVISAANTFRYYGAVCETHEGELTPARGEYYSLVRYLPVGVVGAITPWNSPATLEAQKLAPILAAGNAVILKPSEITPLIGLQYARLAQEAGFPKGTISVLIGNGDLGQAMVNHPGIDMISFTGGTSTGRHIARLAADRLKPLVLELGGKSPNIVFSDANLELAANGVADGIFSGAGESCVAGSRIFVEASIFDEFVDRLVVIAERLKVGPPDEAGVKIGPLISAAHRAAVHKHVKNAVAEGAKLVAGGTLIEDSKSSAGFYYPPTLLTQVENHFAICQQEVFGPVGAILKFETDHDLVAQANDSEFGLAAGLWTQNLERAWRIAERLQAGTVWINTYRQLSISTPFEGHKQSGLGREKGIHGMLSYMQTQAVFWSKTAAEKF